MQGFIRRRIPIFVRRAITLAPALLVLAIGLNPTDALVASQVVLSFGIPFALVPLVMIAARPRGDGGAGQPALADRPRRRAGGDDHRPQRLPAPAGLLRLDAAARRDPGLLAAARGAGGRLEPGDERRGDQRRARPAVPDDGAARARRARSGDGRARVASAAAGSCSSACCRSTTTISGLERIEPGRGFLERSTMLSQRLWEHERTIEPVAGGGCTIADRVAWEPRLPLPGRLLRPLFAAVFRHRHRRLRRHFGAAEIMLGFGDGPRRGLPADPGLDAAGLDRPRGRPADRRREPLRRHGGRRSARSTPSPTRRPTGTGACWSPTASATRPRPRRSRACWPSSTPKASAARCGCARCARAAPRSCRCGAGRRACARSSASAARSSGAARGAGHRVVPDLMLGEPGRGERSRAAGPRGDARGRRCRRRISTRPTCSSPTSTPSTPRRWSALGAAGARLLLPRRRRDPARGRGRRGRPGRAALADGARTAASWSSAAGSVRLTPDRRPQSGAQNACSRRAAVRAGRARGPSRPIRAGRAGRTGAGRRSGRRACSCASCSARSRPGRRRAGRRALGAGCCDGES